MNPISPLRKVRHAFACRGLTTKFGSLLMLFQRSPLVQMLFPEARVLGTAGLGEVTKWTIKAVVGLGAFDSVAGATTIAQISPNIGQSEVQAFTGELLNFVVQITGTPSDDQVSWSVDGLPPGLSHSDLTPPSNHLIRGIPTEAGQTTVTVTAWEDANQTGSSFSQEFLLIVSPPIILTHPASTAILSGSKATLSVVGNPNGGTLTYRWYRGSSGNTTNPVTGISGDDATYTTITHNATNTPATYWVQVTQNGVVQNSNTATVTIATAPAITTQPVSTSVVSGGTANLSIATSGSTPTIQWYQGNSGVITNPVPGAILPTFTTPTLTSTTSFWARASNAAGFVNSNAATVTVTVDPYQEWRAAQFSPAQLGDPQVSGTTADPDGDGITNQDEYVFGTVPLTREPSPLAISVTNGNQVSLAFTAKLASGAGYSGKTRHYALDSRIQLSSGTWTPLPTFEDIVGSNQTVTYLAPANLGRAFYALRVWLTP